jgi:hypothetical protein
MSTTVTPPYGKDFSNPNDAKASWIAGDEWIIGDITNRWNGKPCSIRDTAALGGVMLRFNALRDTTYP